MSPAEAITAVLRDVLDEFRTERDESEPDDPALIVNRTWCAAARSSPGHQLGPSSIWALADQAAKPEPQADLFGAPELQAPTLAQVAPHRRMTDKVRRVGAHVVVHGMAYPSGRWTDERAEAERVRRAKQVVPKPVAAARVFRVGKGA